MMVLLELLARREKMSRVSIPLYLGDEAMKQWLTDSVKRGYELDESCTLFGFDADMEGFEVWSKVFSAAVPVPAVVPVAVSSSSSVSNTSTTTQSTTASTVEEEKLSSIFTKATDLAASSDN